MVKLRQLNIELRINDETRKTIFKKNKTFEKTFSKKRKDSSTISNSRFKKN